MGREPSDSRSPIGRSDLVESLGYQIYFGTGATDCADGSQPVTRSHTPTPT